MSYLGIDDLIRTVEQANGEVLTDEERSDVEFWRKGRDIGTLVSHPGWPTILEMLQEYPLAAVKQLLLVRPGENDRVLAAQAVAYALSDFVDKFNQDVQRAVEASKRTPDVMRRGLRGTSPGPPETMY